jgi:phosphoglycerate dehydrogenase-like enzyme
MMSPDIIDDDVFQRLMTFANVLVTGHQGFFTVKAMHEIAQVTFRNIRDAAARGSRPKQCPGKLTTSATPTSPEPLDGQIGMAGAPIWSRMPT